jgi:hypothetical protein
MGVKINSSGQQFVIGDGILVGNSKTAVVCGGCMRKGNKTFLLTIDKHNNVAEQIITQKFTHDKSSDTVDIDYLNSIVASWVDQVHFLLIFIIIIIIIIIIIFILLM